MNKKSLQKILLILPNNLGDVIMATPALCGLRKKYPGAEITFFVEEGFDGGLINNPDCDRIFRFSRKDIRDTLRAYEPERAINELKDILNELNSIGFDLVINLSQLSYISKFTSLIESKKRLGRYFLREGNDAVFDWWSQYLYAIPFARKYNNLHAADVYRRICGVKYSCGYKVRLHENELKEASEYIKSKNIDPEKERIALFQPGAAQKSKRWPPQSFIELGKMLSEKGWKIIVSGAPAERETAESISSGIGDRAFNSAGETTFRQAVANLSFSDACVTGDTALMHASAALGVSTFAMFGMTSPVETGPFGENCVVFSTLCDKRPCFESKCSDNKCMKKISPMIIFNAIVNDELCEEGECEIYKTFFDNNGDYSLKRIDSRENPYIEAGGVFFNRTAFDDRMPGIQHQPLLSEDDEKIIDKVTEIIADMEGALRLALDEKDTASIKRFEKLKESLHEPGGIACFWSAVLNIKLNSIPVIDPLQGISLSLQACAETKNQMSGWCERTNDKIV